MPIQFEQPSPEGYSPLAGVPGQVAQGNLDRQYLMQMTQLGIEAGKAARPDYASASAVGNANAQRATQAAIAGQQGNVSMADIYHGNQQLTLQGNQIAAAQQMQADQFTYQDQVRLSQMQNALSSVDNNPDLSDEEKANYKMQLQTGINPYLQRQQAAQAKLKQQQTQDEMDAAARLNKIQGMNAVDRAQYIKDSTVDLGNGNSMTVDPSTGKHIITKNMQTDEFGGAVSGTAGSRAAGGKGGGMGMGEFSGMSQYDSTAALEKYLPHFKNETGVVDPAAAKKFVADEEKEHQAKFQQAEADGAQRFITNYQAKYGGDSTKAPPQATAKRERAIDTIVSQPLPDNEAGIRKQADLLNSLYPPGSQIPPNVWRRAQEIRNTLKNNQTSEGQRRANVPEAIGGEQPPTAQAATAQQPWAAGAANLRARGYAGGQFTGTDGRDYIMDKQGNVRLVPNSAENFGAGVRDIGDRFRRGLGVVNQDALDLRDLLHEKLGTTGYGG